MLYAAMVDYKLAVYNACRDNNLNGLMVSKNAILFRLKLWIQFWRWRNAIILQL